MTRIFISYARADTLDIARKLAGHLRENNHIVFLDVQNIVGGTNWRLALEKEVKKADLIVVLVSPASNESDFVYKEIEEARKKGKPILPVQIGDTPLPVYLRDIWQAVKFNEPDFGSLLYEIQRSLEENREEGFRYWRYVVIAIIGIVSLGIVFQVFLANKEDETDANLPSRNPPSANSSTHFSTVTSDLTATQVTFESASITLSPTSTQTDLPTYTATATTIPSPTSTYTNSPTYFVTSYPATMEQNQVTITKNSVSELTQIGQAPFLGHTDIIRALAVSLDSKYLASGSRDNTIQLWEVATGDRLKVLAGHTAEVRTLVFSPNGEFLASGSQDRTIRLWNVSTGEESSILLGHEDTVSCIAFSPDGKLMVSGSFDGSIRIWDFSSGQAIYTLKQHTRGVQGVAFSPDGRRVVSSGSEGSLILWDAKTGVKISSLDYGGDIISFYDVAFSPQGDAIAVGDSEGNLHLWDFAKNEIITFPRKHVDKIFSITFNSDGSLLVSASADGSVMIWNVAELELLVALNYRKLFNLEATIAVVDVVIFSPSDMFIATGSRDNAIRLWGLQ